MKDKCTHKKKYNIFIYIRKEKMKKINWFKGNEKTFFDVIYLILFDYNIFFHSIFITHIFYIWLGIRKIMILYVYY